MPEIPAPTISMSKVSLERSGIEPARALGAAVAVVVMAWVSV
jgi:hypothetical protein